MKRIKSTKVWCVPGTYQQCYYFDGRCMRCGKLMKHRRKV